MDVRLTDVLVLWLIIYMKNITTNDMVETELLNGHEESRLRYFKFLSMGTLKRLKKFTKDL